MALMLEEIQICTRMFLFNVAIYFGDAPTNNVYEVFYIFIVSMTSSHLSLTTIHRGIYYCTHFRDEKTEGQRHSIDLLVNASL